MKFLQVNLLALTGIVFGLICSSFGNNNNRAVSNGETRVHSSGTIMDPFGFWKSTGGILSKGIRSFRENLQEGVKIAKMLKEDMNDGLSNIVPRRTSSNRRNSTSISVEDSSGSREADFSLADHSKQLLREGMLGGILRFVGFDSNSIGIIVLNVLVFIAEMVTSSLLGKESNSINDKRLLQRSLFEFLATGRNEKVEHIFQEAQNKSLPENLINLLQSRTGNKTSCVQLLLCKLKPLIWGVQKTVDDQLNNSSTTNPQLSTKYMTSVWDQLNRVLPDKTNFINYGDDCEKKHSVCQLLKFQKNT